MTAIVLVSMAEPFVVVPCTEAPVVDSISVVVSAVGTGSIVVSPRSVKIDHTAELRLTNFSLSVKR